MNIPRCNLGIQNAGDGVSSILSICKDRDSGYSPPPWLPIYLSGDKMFEMLFDKKFIRVLYAITINYFLVEVIRIELAFIILIYALGLDYDMFRFALFFLSGFFFCVTFLNLYHYKKYLPEQISKYFLKIWGEPNDEI